MGTSWWALSADETERPNDIGRVSPHCPPDIARGLVVLCHVAHAEGIASVEVAW